jgi:uncharacterized protein YlxW (UPF0749 family)
MDIGMAFQTFKENPQASTIILSVIGLLSADGLSTTDIGVLGRSLIYLGETLQTVALFIAAFEVEEAANTSQATEIKEDQITTVGKEEFGELQKQNQNLQEQIWTLQETLSKILNKS